MNDRIHTVKTVAQRTGLSAHVIRVWEKRYQAVTPGRTPGNQRLYSDDEIARLELLRDATQAGHNIGRVAQLPEEKLRALAGVAHGTQPRAAARTAKAENAGELVAQALQAIESLDSARLETILNQAAVGLGQMGFLNDVVAPLAHQIGERWVQGGISAAHEHMASGIIRSALGNSARAMGVHPSAPQLVAATPAGQLHELGAAMAATLAAHQGWRVTYLGSSLPATEIAGAAKQQGARAVALSIVYPHDDPGLADELKNLRAFLPAETKILVGGRAAAAYAEVLQTIGAVQCSSLKTLAEALDDLRTQPRAR
jgi:methanogenic corrinoid protein MtbC1/transposase-like protein